MCHTLACMAYVLTNLSPLSGRSSAGKRVRAQLKMGEHPGWTFLWLILWSEYVLAKLLYILNIEMIPVMWDNTFIFIQSFLNNSRLMLTLSECVINSRDVLCVSCNMCIHIFVSKNPKANNFRHFTCREFSEREND